MKSLVDRFVFSPVVRDSLAQLHDGVSLQLLIDETPFEVLKREGKILVTQKRAERPFVIFKARSDDLNALSSIEDSKNFGKLLLKNVDIKFMAPPGRMTKYGIFAMIDQMGIKPNMI